MRNAILAIGFVLANMLAALATPSFAATEKAARAVTNSSAVESTNRAEKASDAHKRCLVRASTLMVDESVLMVDVRIRDASNVWLPGGARLSLAELASSELVRTASKTVLVGDGKNTPGLVQKCAELQASGLTQVRVLEGGMPAWRNEGGAVVGMTGLLDQPLSLDLREIGQIIRFPGTVALFVGAKPSEAWMSAIAKIVRVGDLESPATALERLPKAQLLIVVLPDIRSVERWRLAARTAGRIDPMFYIGDVQWYDDYLQQQSEIALTASKPRVGMCELN